jgi:hypothetical protein
MDADRKHKPVGEAHGAAHDVEVPKRYGIERSSEECGPQHGRGLACAERYRKNRGCPRGGTLA